MVVVVCPLNSFKQIGMAVYCTNTKKKSVVGHRGLYEASWTEEITLTTGGGGWESIQTDFRKVWTKRKSISKGG